MERGRAPKARLFLEPLEARDCPAAPQITFDAMIQSGTAVMLSGSVMDESPTTVTVTFSGVASGSTTPDQYGNYYYYTEASSLGTIYATAVDAETLSATAQDTITSNAPSITITSIQQLGGHNVRVSGSVTDEHPGGLTVEFSGVVVGSITTNPDGTFALETEASALGTVTASVADVWGLTGSGSREFTNSTPVIYDFVAIDNGFNYWTFQGRVEDEYPYGLVVRLGGIPSLANVTVTVGYDGWFSIDIQLQPGEEGTATADVTDWWDAVADTALADVRQDNVPISG